VENGRPKMVQAYPNAITGEKLMKILQTISAKYDVQFMFCDPANTGPTIAALLGGDSGG